LPPANLTYFLGQSAQKNVLPDWSSMKLLPQRDRARLSFTIGKSLQKINAQAKSGCRARLTQKPGS